MHSGFAAYFYESLGGIKSSTTQAGYQTFFVDPKFPSKLENIKISVPTPYGEIKNEWIKKQGKVSMKLKIPFNTMAKLPFTNVNKNSIRINSKTIEELNQNNLDPIVLGSGNYKITFEL
jgi:alpha-L-rhamnosidase